MDGPYWTMIIEMLFYIFLVTLFALGLFRKVLWIGTLLIFTLTFILLQFPGEAVNKALFMVPLLQFFPLFFAGLVFYRIIKKSDNLMICYLLIILCFCAQVLISPYVGRSRMFLSQMNYLLVLGLYFSAFILFVNQYLRFITIRPLLFLGKISYAFYLTHYYVSSRHIIPFLYTEKQLNFWVALLISLFICIIIASFITFYIEIPSNKKIRSIMKIRQGK